uniref:Uncharacterized protein n=3 Tax=Ciona intestinalis TaxID=7719 RepID=H2XPF8_CIOIN
MTPATVVFTPLVKTNFNVSQSGDCTNSGKNILKVPEKSPEERVLSYMISMGIDSDELMSWPSGVSLPIQTILKKSSENPDLSLPSAAFQLLGRADLVSQLQPEAGNWKTAKLCPSTDPMRYTWTDAASSDENDEIYDLLREEKEEEELKEERSGPDSSDDNVTRLLFPSDHRMADAHHLL